MKISELPSVDFVKYAMHRILEVSSRRHSFLDVTADVIDVFFREDAFRQAQIAQTRLDFVDLVFRKCHRLAGYF